MDQIKSTAKKVAALVFLADFVHVHRYLANYYDNDEEETEEERLKEDAEVIARYQDDCAEKDLISQAQFEARVEAALKKLEDSANGTHELQHRLRNANMKILRESIGFAGGGRATYMQLAHPFIAAGIRDHSYLNRGVSRRFYNTFKYMFGLLFGDSKEIAASARTVRHMHNKVKGTLGEDLGFFKANSKFDASQAEAMRYVEWTLIETAIFEYELHVGMLTTEEKDETVRQACAFLLLFGVPPLKDEESFNYAMLRRKLNAMYRSKVLTVSDTALDTQEFLLLPPSPIYAPMMNFVKWSTLVSLPPKLGQQYGGRSFNTWYDRFLFAFMHAIIRFFYRITPGSFRYISSYLKMVDRAYPNSRSYWSRMLSSASASVTTVLLKYLMPERDPEETTARVKVIRAEKAKALVN